MSELPAEKAPDPMADVSEWTAWKEWGLGAWQSWWYGNPTEGDAREEDFRRSMRELHGLLWLLMTQFAQLKDHDKAAAARTARTLIAQLPRWSRYCWLIYGDQATALRVLFPGEVKAPLPEDGAPYQMYGNPVAVAAAVVGVGASVAIVAYVVGSAYECRVNAEDNARILAAAERTNSPEAVNNVAKAKVAQAERPGAIQQLGTAARDSGAGFGMGIGALLFGVAALGALYVATQKQ